MKPARKSRRVLLCILAVVPLVAASETLAGALFGAILGTLLLPILGTILGLVLGGVAGCLTGLPVGVACALVLVPYLALRSGGAREGRCGRFVLGAAALCAAAAPALLLADWATQPYFPRLETLLPYRLAFALLDPGAGTGPPQPEDPVGAAIVETFLLIFTSCGAALGGACASVIAAPRRREERSSPEGNAGA